MEMNQNHSNMMSIVNVTLTRRYANNVMTCFISIHKENAKQTQLIAKFIKMKLVLNVYKDIISTKKENVQIYLQIAQLLMRMEHVLNVFKDSF